MTAASPSSRQSVVERTGVKSPTRLDSSASCESEDKKPQKSTAVSDATAIVPEVLEELTPEEEKERHRLELKVERAFVEAGSSLRQLRDKRLYRSTHRTFEEYCRHRFGYNRSRSYQLIDAAVVVDNLKQCPQIVDIFPTTESQCRPLAKLQPHEQWQVWTEAVEQTGGKVPSGRIVKSIVERLKEKPLRYAHDFCAVGDIFALTGLVEVERKYNGYPCVVSELGDFTVKVDVHDGVIRVKPENLQPIDSPDGRSQLPTILKRIKRLRQRDLDRGAYPILESLGRQTYLTDLEEKLLTFLEQEYGIK